MRLISAICLTIGFLLTVAGTAMLFLPGPGALTLAVGLFLICASSAGFTRQPPPDL